MTCPESQRNFIEPVPEFDPFLVHFSDSYSSYIISLTTFIGFRNVCPMLGYTAKSLFYMKD